LPLPVEGEIKASSNVDGKEELAEHEYEHVVRVQVANAADDAANVGLLDADAAADDATDLAGFPVADATDDELATVDDGIATLVAIISITWTRIAITNDGVIARTTNDGRTIAIASTANGNLLIRYIFKIFSFNYYINDSVEFIESFVFVHSFLLSTL
jgi:hypothetical protein